MVVVNDRRDPGLRARQLAAHHTPLPRELHGNTGQLHGKVHGEINWCLVGQSLGQNKIKSVPADGDRFSMRVLLLAAAAFPMNLYGKFKWESDPAAQKVCPA